MIKISNRNLSAVIQKQLKNSKKLQSNVRVLVEKQFKIAHEKLMSDFDRHAITRELSAGAGGDNFTGTLREGNLFGFIGFDKTDDPIGALRSALAQANILIHKRAARAPASYVYRVNIPTKEELYKITPLPWAKGASWLHQLEERGISNLGQYAFRESTSSRSGAGIQTKLEGGGRLKLSYLNPILKEFERSLNQIRGHIGI